MRFNVISNLTNGVGLQQDYELLREALERRGHLVAGVQFNKKPFTIKPADINIFLEVVNPQAFAAAPQQWVVPNPEWWFAGWEAHHWDRVLTKTRDAERIFKAKVGSRCQYLGWLARDLFDPAIPRHRHVLHIAGKSRFKNTTAVIAGCKEAGVSLTVIGEHFTGPRKRVGESELKRLMKSHF